MVRPALVQQFLDGLADRPGAQQRARVAIKAVERWALVRDLMPFPITTGTEIIGLPMDELIEAYDDYLEILGDAERHVLGFAVIRGYQCPHEMVRRGKEMREKIARLKSQLLPHG